LELYTLTHSDRWILDLFLFISFVLLALSKHIAPNIFNTLVYFFTDWNTTVTNHGKKTHRLTFANIILLSAFVFISICIGLTLCMHHNTSSENISTFSFRSTFLLSIQIFFISTVYHFLCLWLFGILTREISLFKTFAYQLLINILCLGIIAFSIVLLWLFHFQWASTLYQLFVMAVIFFGGIILLKIILICFRNKVPWYYIILYLCTLELLPFLLLNTLFL